MVQFLFDNVKISLRSKNLNVLSHNGEQNKLQDCLAVPGRLNNLPKPHDDLNSSTVMLQPIKCTSQVCPLLVVTMPSIGRSHFEGRRAANTLHWKNTMCHTYMSANQKKLGDVQSVTWQSAITFYPQQVTKSPAYWHVGSTMEYLFVWNLCWENGFKGLKTQNVQKICEIF